MESLNDYKIYKYTNRVNGKVYIGQTCRTLEERARYNGRGYQGCCKFWSAIRKYGWESFEPEILKKGLTSSEAVEFEEFYIRKYNSVEEGYNTLYKSNLEFSEGYRNNMSNAVKNSEHAKERSRKISNSLKGDKNPFYGKHHTEQTKEILREYRKGKKLSEETKRKISEAITGGKNPFRGRRHSKESKEKMRKAKLGKKLSEETREKLRISGLGRKVPQEIRDKISKTHMEKGTYNSIKVMCVETKEVYKSMAEVSRILNVSVDRVKYACKHKNKILEGFHWAFI